MKFLEIQESHKQAQQVLESNFIILSPNSDFVADLIDDLY